MGGIVTVDDAQIVSGVSAGKMVKAMPIMMLKL
jgi:hypothetical protein